MRFASVFGFAIPASTEADILARYILYQTAIGAFFFICRGENTLKIISEYCKTGLLVTFNVTERGELHRLLLSPLLFFLLLQFIHEPALL